MYGKRRTVLTIHLTIHAGYAIGLNNTSNHLLLNYYDEMDAMTIAGYTSSLLYVGQYTNRFRSLGTHATI